MVTVASASDISFVVTKTANAKSKDVTRIKSILKDEFSKYGYGGIWSAALIEKTGAKIQTDFKFRRLDPGSQGRKASIMVICKAGSRDSIFNISVTPPDSYDINDVVANLENVYADDLAVDRKEQAEQEALEKARKEKEQRDKDLAEAAASLPPGVGVGQIYDAQVVGKARSEAGGAYFGLYVEVENPKLSGLVPLQYLSKDYNIKDLRKFNIGQKIRVAIVKKRDNNLFVFSADDDTLADLSDTNDPNDPFTGVPGEDGLLWLKGLTGYKGNLDRKLMVLKWICELITCEERHPIGYSTVVEHLVTELKHAYGAAKIDTRSFHSVLKPLMDLGWIAKYGKNKVKDGQGGQAYYRVLPLGWSEAGMDEFPVNKQIKIDGEIMDVEAAEEYEASKNAPPVVYAPKPQTPQFAQPQPVAEPEPKSIQETEESEETMSLSDIAAETKIGTHSPLHERLLIELGEIEVKKQKLEARRQQILDALQ